MGKKKDELKGAFGRSPGYSGSTDDQILAELNEAIKMNEGMETDRVEPEPMQFSPKDVTPRMEPPVTEDAYAAMARRLEEAVGPEEEFQPGVLGGIQEFASGLPGGAVPATQVNKAQQKAAMDLSEMMNKRTATASTSPKISEKGFGEMSEGLSRIKGNRQATLQLRKFFMNKNSPETKAKLGKLQGLIDKASYLFKREAKVLSVEEARAMAKYWEFVNGQIKAITGAQMSEPEARRLMQQMPDPFQNPEAFLGVWDDNMEAMERPILNKINSYVRGGWANLEGIMPEFMELKSSPYQRTVWPKKKGKSQGNIARANGKNASRNPAQKSKSAEVNAARISEIKKEKEELYKKFPKLRK